MHKLWVEFEAAFLNWGANKVEANSDRITAFVVKELELVKGTPTVAQVRAAIDKRAGPLLGGLINEQLDKIEAEGGAELPKDLPSLFTRVVAGIRQKAADLEKSVPQ